MEGAKSDEKGKIENDRMKERKTERKATSEVKISKRTQPLLSKTGKRSRQRALATPSIEKGEQGQSSRVATN